MPCTSELAQLPTPAMARRMVLMSGILPGTSAYRSRGPVLRCCAVWRPRCRAAARPPNRGLLGCGSRPIARPLGINLGEAGPLLGDEAVEPGQVGGQGCAVALAERAEIAVQAPVGLGPGALVGSLGELGAAAFEQGEAVGGSQDAAERHPQREGAVVGHVGVGQQLDQAAAAGLGDAVHLLAARPASGGGRRPPLGAEGGQLARQRPAHRAARRCRHRLGRHDLDQAVALQARQRGVERAERDGQAQADQVAQALAQLVAVEVVLVEEAEDGEFQHRSVRAARRSYIVESYRFDISERQCAGSSTERQPAFAELRWSAAARPPIPLPSLLMSFRPEAIRGVSSNGGVVDYRLTRQAVVREYRKGRLSRLDVCDAHPELQRAAAGAGAPTSEPCPICEEEAVVLVTYAFGPRLPAGGRCVTTAKEMTRLTRGPVQVSCYVVEVCPGCAWNHLTRVFQVGGS